MLSLFLKIPHCRLTSPLQGTPLEYPHKTYIARNYSYWATFLLLANFRDGLRKRRYLKTDCVMAVQGHPRSLTLTPI